MEKGQAFAGSLAHVPFALRQEILQSKALRASPTSPHTRCVTR